ncbi:MAG TPA: hypothetical protein PKC45_05595, partial [Gemmatales bacterium]|nr:hypothetical protein [Gemmatales bacterium]
MSNRAFGEDTPRAGVARGSGADHQHARPVTGEGDAVFVACSTLCYSHLPLDEALEHIAELDFAKVDLAIHPASPHLTPA